MNHIHPTRRVASILAGLATGLLTLATASPAAFARPWPHSIGPTAPATPRPQPPGWNKHPPLPAPSHAVAPSAPASWQIILIAAAAVLLAAAAAVIVYRIRAVRQRTTTSTT